MKCPVCEREGKKSIVYPGGSSETCMGYIPYYDEEGNHHVHNTNKTIETFCCSEDHHWSVVSRRACLAPSCSFQGLREIKIRED